MRNSITDIDQLSIGGLYEMAVNNSLTFQKPYDILYMWQSNEKLDAGERTRIK